MSWYESQVDKVVGIVPRFEYKPFGLEFLPTLNTRDYAKSVLMPGHAMVDIYEGDKEAILYAEQTMYYTAGGLWIQYLATGTASERALYGIAKMFKRAPTVIVGIDIYHGHREARRGVPHGQRTGLYGKGAGKVYHDIGQTFGSRTRSERRGYRYGGY